MMVQFVRIPAVIMIMGLVIGCSTVTTDHPDDSLRKCETCHALPPQDSITAPGKDPAMVRIHYKHVTQNLYSCDICHPGYNRSTGKWTVSADHYSDTARGYDTTRCVKCHTYPSCNTDCHSTPPTGNPVLEKIHTLHARPLDPTTTDTLQKYRCQVCHKGFDVENIVQGFKTPLDLPAYHDDGISDNNVIFDLPFPNDTQSLPVYYETESIGACDFIYCHGTTLPGGKKRVTITDKVDTLGNHECNFCHDTLALETQVDEHVRPDHVENFKACLNCHNGYALKTGSDNKKLHINGRIDLSCSTCHTDSLPYPYKMMYLDSISDSVIIKMP